MSEIGSLGHLRWIREGIANPQVETFRLGAREVEGEFPVEGSPGHSLHLDQYTGQTDCIARLSAQQYDW